MLGALQKLLKPMLFKHSPHDHSDVSLRLENLTVRYDGVRALEHIDLTALPGERIAVVGPNGAGKSTLFKAIVGLEKPSTGKVHIYGHAPHGHICIGYVPQKSAVDWDFPVTVYDVVMMGRAGKLGLFRYPGSKDREMVFNALKLVQMEEYASRQIRQLSGGQQQRVFIARALAQEAELLLMDEPFTGLDVTTMEDIFSILNLLRERKVTVLVSLHDLDLASNYFEKVVLLNRKIISCGSPSEVFAKNHLEAAYGGHLHVVENGDGAVMIGDSCCGGGRSDA